MSQAAYVLIEAQVGHAPAILRAIREVSGVREAHVITGPYSLIAILEAADTNGVGRLVADRIHSIPGVLRTITCLALRP